VFDKKYLARSKIKDLKPLCNLTVQSKLNKSVVGKAS